MVWKRYISAFPPKGLLFLMIIKIKVGTPIVVERFYLKILLNKFRFKLTFISVLLEINPIIN
jgi:hypothetical protein